MRKDCSEHKIISGKTPIKRSVGFGLLYLLCITTGLLSFSGAQAQPPIPVETDTLAPFVTSTIISSFTSNTATLGGNVTGNGGAVVTERGVVLSSANTLPTVGDTKVIMGSGNGPYSQAITGLNGGTTYYVRAYAINIIGTSYGAVVSFTTNASPPLITTNEATAIGNTTATVGGDISYSGGAAVTERGVVYSSSHTLPTVADTKVQVGAGAGNFSQALTGLTQGTLYYLRAYAINAAGISYGTAISFTPAGATVSSNIITNITTASALMGGNVTSAGSSPVTEKGVVYLTGSGVPAITDTKVAMGNGPGVFSQTIGSLSPATTYSVRAYATNGTATNYGSLQTFTTQTSISSITRSGTLLTNAIVITYTVVFAQAITGLTTNNFSLTATGVSNAYVTAVSGSGTVWTVTAYSGTGNGTVTLNLANSTGISPGISNPLPFAGETYTIDRVAPMLSLVSVFSSNQDTSVARMGDTVKLRLISTESIAAPVVTLAGSNAVSVNTSGNTWIVTYVLTATDAEGIIPITVQFSDIAGNAGMPVSATTNNTAVVFDRTVPSVISINRVGLSPVNTTTIDFSIAFSESVRGVDVTDFVLTTTQSITATSVASVTSSSSMASYTITVNTGSGTGTIRLDLKSSGTGITDAAGNQAGGFSAGQTYSILRKPILQINTPAAVCSPATVDLTDPAITRGGDAGLSFAYFTDAASTVSLINPFAVGTSGTYYIVGSNQLGTASDPYAVTVTVNVFQKPAVAFSFDSYCAGKAVQFTDLSQKTGTGAVDYEWSDDGGHKSVSVSPLFTYTSAGTYLVKLKLSSTFCPAVTDSSTQSITIATPSPAVRLPDVHAIVNEPLPLQARSIGNAYQWSPATGLSSATVANPTFTDSKEILYAIRMTAASGCQTVDSLRVRVFDKHLYVPNVFSPNGDGINDVLYINTVRIQLFHYFRVFNRYGKMVFESTNAAVGWNGRWNSQLQPVDTYVWTAEAVNSAGAKVNRQGTVTLLR